MAEHLTRIPDYRINKSRVATLEECIQMCRASREANARAAGRDPMKETA